jgi:hypothetical protein
MTHDAFMQSAEVVHSKTQMNQLMVNATEWRGGGRWIYTIGQTEDGEIVFGNEAPLDQRKHQTRENYGYF